VVHCISTKCQPVPKNKKVPVAINKLHVVPYVILYSGHVLGGRVKSLIRFAHSGLKSSFFIWGFKINFQEKKIMEWQRENMATSGIMKSFDPIKKSL
jgi:hypothetical protein